MHPWYPALTAHINAINVGRLRRDAQHLQYTSSILDDGVLLPPIACFFIRVWSRQFVAVWHFNVAEWLVHCGSVAPLPNQNLHHDCSNEQNATLISLHVTGRERMHLAPTNL